MRVRSMFLDIGIGILLSLGLAHGFGVEPTWSMVAVGVGSSLLPDIDILLLWLFPKLEKHIGPHRSALHYPLWYIPLAAAVLLIWGPFWALLVGLGVAWHFLHDMMWLGWGIVWGGPFSKQKIKLFPLRGTRIVWRQAYIAWYPEEEAQIRAQWWGPEHWIQAFFLRPHFISVSEYGVCLLGLAALAWQFW